jgi:hypothetical protein
MISGFTSHKLDLVKTYSSTNPYQVGVNGVTNVTYKDQIALTGITFVSYSIGDINYTTRLSDLNTTFFTNSSGYDFEPYITFPNKQNTFDIKEEAKMGLVSPPKINNELFIERQDLAVFERYSRFSEIKNLNDLTYYRNGYYNIKQTV